MISAIPSEVYAAACDYVAAGLSVIPVNLDGSKQPAWSVLPLVWDEQERRDIHKWKPYQSRFATAEELRGWFLRGGFGIAIACGEQSGCLECIDIEAFPDVVEEFISVLANDWPDLFHRLTIVETGSGGRHVWYRCQDRAGSLEGSKKLAWPPKPTEAGVKFKALIETRGEGGYAVVPGSPLSVHESGNAYTHISGPSLINVQTISGDERDYLIRLAKSFDHTTPPASQTKHPQQQEPGLSPWDDFDRRGWPFEQLLEGTGASFATGSGDHGKICRPGKERGWGATAGHCKGSHGEPLLHVFTSSWPPFEPGKCYGKFHVYRLLHCDGDWGRATRELRAKGFGDPIPPPREVKKAEPFEQSKGKQSESKAAKNDDVIRLQFEEPKPLSLLKRADPNTSWLWKGFISRQKVTLLSALWKVGKTTLLAHLLKVFDRGGLFCGLPVFPAKVLYVTEEAESQWATRRDNLELGDHVHVQIRPFRSKPRLGDWIDFMAHIETQIASKQYDLVVIDTLANLGPIRDENDAGVVGEALMPLTTISKTAAVLLIHHLRKGDGSEATGSRGSGALPAYVDTIMEMRRFNAGDRNDRRRMLTSYGRDDETPAELVAELTDAGYVAHGNREEVVSRSIRTTLESLLPCGKEGWTREEIIDAWPGETSPKLSVLIKELTEGVLQGHFVQSGEGKRNDPKRYSLPESFRSQS